MLGSLLDLVEIERGWEAAVEAALGEALASVVVTDAGVARRALGHLHEAGVHGGVLAPGTAPSGRTTTPAVGLTRGRSVRSLVRADDAKVATVLDDLLAGAVVVDGQWSDALDLALAHADVTVVTRAGDRFSPAGFRVGSGGAGATAAALDEARTTSAAAAVNVTTAEHRLVSVGEERDALDAGHESLRARLESAGRRAHRGRAGRGRGAPPLRRPASGARPGPIRARRLRGRRCPGGRGHRRARAVPRGPGGGRGHGGGGGASALRAAAPPRGAGPRPLAIRRRDLAVRTAGVDERLPCWGSGCRTSSAAWPPAAGRRPTPVLASSSSSARRVAVERLAELVERHRRTVELRLTELHEQRRRQTEEARAATLALEQLRVERADAERRLAEVAERQRRCEISEAEVRTRARGRGRARSPRARHGAVRGDGARAAAPSRRCHGGGPGAGPGAGDPPDGSRSTRWPWRSSPRCRSATASSRSSWRTSARPARELQRVIRSVDAEIQSVFAAAFADVSENFTALFTTLFPVDGPADPDRSRRPARHRHRGRGQAVRQEREEAVAAVGRRALAHRAGLPVRGVPQPAVALLRHGRGRGRPRRRQPPPLPRPRRRVPGRRAAPRGQPPEAHDGGGRLPHRRHHAAGRLLEGPHRAGHDAGLSEVRSRGMAGGDRRGRGSAAGRRCNVAAPTGSARDSGEGAQ